MYHRLCIFFGGGCTCSTLFSFTRSLDAIFFFKRSPMVPPPLLVVGTSTTDFFFSTTASWDCLSLWVPPLLLSFTSGALKRACLTFAMTALMNFDTPPSCSSRNGSHNFGNSSRLIDGARLIGLQSGVDRSWLLRVEDQSIGFMGTFDCAVAG
jgi:hypothetical protein